MAVSTTGRPICRDLGPQGKSLSHGAPTTLRHALTLPFLAQLPAAPDTPAAALQSAAPQLRCNAGSGAAQPPHPAPECARQPDTRQHAAARRLTFIFDARHARFFALESGASGAASRLLIVRPACAVPTPLTRLISPSALCRLPGAPGAVQTWMRDRDAIAPSKHSARRAGAAPWTRRGQRGALRRGAHPSSLAASLQPRREPRAARLRARAAEEMWLGRHTAPVRDARCGGTRHAAVSGLLCPRTGPCTPSHLPAASRGVLDRCKLWTLGWREGFENL